MACSPAVLWLLAPPRPLPFVLVRVLLAVASVRLAWVNIAPWRMAYIELTTHTPAPELAGALERLSCFRDWPGLALLISVVASVAVVAGVCHRAASASLWLLALSSLRVGYPFTSADEECLVALLFWIMILPSSRLVWAWPALQSERSGSRLTVVGFIAFLAYLLSTCPAGTAAFYGVLVIAWLAAWALVPFATARQPAAGAGAVLCLLPLLAGPVRAGAVLWGPVETAQALSALAWDTGFSPISSPSIEPTRISVRSQRSDQRRIERSLLDERSLHALAHLSQPFPVWLGSRSNEVRFRAFVRQTLANRACAAMPDFARADVFIRAVASGSCVLSFECHGNVGALLPRSVGGEDSPDLMRPSKQRVHPPSADAFDIAPDDEQGLRDFLAGSERSRTGRLIALVQVAERRAQAREFGEAERLLQEALGLATPEQRRSARLDALLQSVRLRHQY